MRRTTIPAHLGHAFAVRDALAEGVAYSRLRCADLEIPFPGVRRYGEHIAPVDSAIPEAHRPSVENANALSLAHSYFAVDRPDDLFLSHTTAALLLGLPIPSSCVQGDHIEVCRLAPAKRPSGRHVRGHQVEAGLVRRTRYRGLPISDAASTWAMLAERQPVAELVALGDAAIRVPRMPGTPAHPDARGLATLDELRAAVGAGRRRGIVKLRAALPLIRQGSSSRPESLLRLQLSAPGMPRLSLDHDVFDERGRLLGCSELAYPDIKVAIEYESAHHRVDRTQWNRDIKKYADYSGAGWEVVRITAHHLFAMPGEPLRLVRAAAARAGWRP